MDAERFDRLTKRSASLPRAGWLCAVLVAALVAFLHLVARIFVSVIR